MHKIVHAFAAITFLIFCFLQWNDPDPITWILVYGLASVLAVFAYLQLSKIPINIMVVVMIILSSILAVQAFPGIVKMLAEGNISEVFQKMSAHKPYIEETREFLGLAIVLAYAGLAWVTTKR